SQAEKYAVPQPSSTTSSPATSPSRFSSDSSMPQTPQEISSSAQLTSAFASVYSAFDCVQIAAFLAASLRQSDEPIGEPDPDLTLGRLGRVTAVDEVVRHRQRELAAQRAGIGVGRVRRAYRLAAGGDRTVALEDEREGRSGGDELDEVAEERLLA